MDDAKSKIDKATSSNLQESYDYDYSTKKSQFYNNNNNTKQYVDLHKKND